ncbi:MAG: DUF255 domain-containing protein [Nanoarchaeota archaeon]
MINFKKNNLDKSSSPYLLQHKDNPIYWQEWSSEVLEYARKNDKILFVSVGYATCHWCHVMAAEAFSDKDVADFLNANVVSIKVDKEQRPDIDNYMISFIQETQGQGGWPLNVFLTPDAKPFVAVTYIPIEPHYGLSGFLDLLRKVKEAYERYKGEIQRYLPLIREEQSVEEQDIVQIIKDSFFKNGFGSGVQFPPHNTLLFLLSYYENNNDNEIKKIIENILDVMMMRGLHDHLQGGFFRYCTDASWTIPHFEKMLYDQAMHVWVYGVAYKILKKPEYKTIVEKIIICLEDTYAHDGLYYTAHDADTNHQEGRTYLWDKEELSKELSTSEYKQFVELYESENNFEGRIHIIKKNNLFLNETEKTLLQIRNKREQPFTDKKFLTSSNALIGIGLIIAYRSLGDQVLRQKAIALFENILEKHYHHGVLYHSSYDGKLQSGEFLEDYAAILLYATYMYEETGEYKDKIEELYSKLCEFYVKDWIESRSDDFMMILAQTTDHPTPSSASLAEMAQLRACILLRKPYSPMKYKQSLQHDFFNLMAFVSKGNWHVLHTPHKIEWNHLPSNCIQIRDARILDCYKQKCLEYNDVSELLASL